MVLKKIKIIFLFLISHVLSVYYIPYEVIDVQDLVTRPFTYTDVEGQTVNGVVRQLTNRECLRLMGYDDDFKIVVPDQQMYRQSGNSIVVNVLIALVQEIIKTGVFA